MISNLDLNFSRRCQQRREEDLVLHDRGSVVLLLTLVAVVADYPGVVTRVGWGIAVPECHLVKEDLKVGTLILRDVVREE